MPASETAVPPRAVTMAEGGEPAGQQLSEAAQHGLDVVLGMIGRLRALDPPRVFWEPVVGIAGYAEKIKHPMSLRVMENKLRAREYRTWRSFTSDFELICSNAKTFNSPNSQIWKLAGQLQRAGRKLLQAEELSGRRALYELHPQGPRVAAAEEEAQILRDAGDAARSSGLMLGMTTSLDGGGARSEEADAGVVDGARRGGGGKGGGGGDDEGAAALPAPPDEDATAAARLWEPEERLPLGNDWGLLFREAPDPSVDSVMQQARLSALHLPYAPGGAAAAAAAGAAPAAPQQQQAGKPAEQQGQQQQQQGEARDGEAGAAAASGAARQPKLPASGRTAEWKAVRRPVEWRARWLELRLLELGSLITQLRSA
ncbi:MAG: hypothetical protein J3K34DRAFT_387532, partial [Monoraphidium minutum]